MGDNIKHKPIIVVLIYRPPNSNDRMALVEIKEFIDHFDNLDKKELLIMGDLKGDLRNVYRCGCLDYMVSDHSPVFIIKKRMASVKEYQQVYKKSLKKL